MEDRTLLSTFLVSNTGDSGPGSLRQAIIDSNNAVGPTNTIDFDISRTGVQTFFPLTPLPAISNPVLIDGSSQPGYAGTPLIELNGSQAESVYPGSFNPVDGLTITGAGITVRGLSIDSFGQGAGIHLTGPGATGDWIYGDVLGTDRTGSQAESNVDGVDIDGGAADNLVGTNGDGINDVPEGNLIAGNSVYGVMIDGQGTDRNVVAGNEISSNATGSNSLPNSTAGVSISANSNNNTIGGATAVAGNLITDNGGPGVVVGSTVGDTCVGNQITANRIFANTGQAIDLGDDGVTDNGTTPRQGPNNLQNFPIIFTSVDGQLQGWLGGSTPDTTFRFDLFASAGYGPGGSGEAELYLRSIEETNDSQGQATFTIPFTAPAGLPIITATATDPNGNTSEVSAVRRATVQAPSVSVRDADNQPSALTTTSGDGIAIEDPDSGPVNPLWDLTLSVSDGTLNLSETTGLTGSGDGTGSLSYSGSLRALDAALQGTIVTPAAGPHGHTTLVTLGAQSLGAPSLLTQFVITDGVYVVDTTADSGPGSLRQAILDTDSEAGLTLTIDFAIPGDRVQTIEPITPLPSITASVLIDGTTQPGFAGAPLIALGSHSSAGPGPLAVSVGNVTIRGIDLSGVTIDPTTDELLIAVVEDPGTTSQLSLLDAQKQLLVQSDGISSDSPDDGIDEHLSAGDYSLIVDTRGGQSPSAWTTMLTPATAPFEPIAVGAPSSFFDGTPAIVAGEFTGDGRLDLAVNDSDGVQILLGNGDGTFQPARTIAAGIGGAMVAGDFNGDGHLDLAVAAGSDTISVLLGNGDGTFQNQVTYAVGSIPDATVAGDFTGDGHLDLAVANASSDTISVLLGNGDGTFQPQVTYAVGSVPTDMVSGDFNGDGHLDLAVAANRSNNDEAEVSVLLGNGDGTFRSQVTYPVGYPQSGGIVEQFGIVAGDFNGDGHLDLADSDYEGVQILLGNGNGTFQPEKTVATGVQGPLVAGEFTGDGHLDLASASYADGNVSVFLGNGDGTFQPQVTYGTGVGLSGFGEGAIAAGDFTGGGRTDLAFSLGESSVSVLLGIGDGTFQPLFQSSNAVGAAPDRIVAGDFNGDGRLDLAVSDYDGVQVLLGNGDGTFQPARTVAVANVGDLVAGDFNGDGRLDLAFANSSNGVSVLLGNGDGTFQPAVSYAVGGIPEALVAGDFNGDGRIDLAVAVITVDPVTITFGGQVSVLLGNGDGTFQPAVSYALEGTPLAIAAGDFRGDGRLDLAVTTTNYNDFNPLTFTYPSDVSVLLGNGDGTFQSAVQYAVGASPVAVLAGDFTGDGHLDLATANSQDNTISVLLGNGDGTFKPQVTYRASFSPTGIVAGDFNGDGKLDLATADDAGTLDSGANIVSVLLGNGDGSFEPQVTFPVGSYPFGIATGDFTGDGKLDLAVTNSISNNVSVLLGTGKGTFVDPGQFDTSPHATPLVADVNGDGTDDALVIDGSGNILYRQGIPGKSGTFEPPITVNPGFPSRDIALVTTGGGPVLASVDAQDDAISLYAWRNGGFHWIGSLTTGQLPAQIIAADLNGDGLDDLVARNAGDGTVSVFFAKTFTGPMNPGVDFQTFFPPVTLSVGLGVSDVQAVDLTGRGRLDLVVTNKLTGQVSVLRNLGNGTFEPSARYRAGTGLSEIDPGGTPEVSSLEATAGVAAGSFTTEDQTDLVTINPGSCTIGVLDGLGGGGFANPITIRTQSPAQVVRMGDFTGNGLDDLAVLTADGVSIYLANGQGGFLPTTTYPVPSESDGLTVADVNHDRKLDLLVGDAYGDVLVLLGNGNGTFAPYHDANQAVELAVTDLTGNGSKDIIYADQGLDRVVVDYGADNSAVLANQSTGLLEPGAVALADLNGDGIPDLIVANSGSNNVLIYPGLGNGQFGPAVNGEHGYFVGTNPVGITVANLTGALPDLVIADEGSNDVSVLVNQSQGQHISFAPAVRFQAGLGPVATVVQNVPGGYPNLLVSDSGSNKVTLLPGSSLADFDVPAETTFSVGAGPGPLFLDNFNGQTDLLTVNAGSNDLTLISGFGGPDPVTSTIPSGGIDPDAAFAFADGSGFEDLVVGNAGDGELALFEGGLSGLSLTAAATEPNLPDPTALAFSALTGGQVQFYAATAGRESAELVAFSLGIETGLSASSDASFAASSVAQLVPLSESSLPLVATVLTFTITVSGNDFNLGLAETESAFLSGTGATVGQGLLSQGRGGPGGDDGAPSDEPETGVAGSVPAVITPWERFVIGLDKALEQFWRDNPDGVSGAPAPGTASDPPAADAPAQGGPTSLKSGSKPGSNSGPSAGEPDRTDNASPRIGVESIDAAVHAIWGENAQLDWPVNVAKTEPCVTTARTEPRRPEPGRAAPVVLEPNQPNLALKSLVVATIATEWLRTCRWHRTVRSRQAGSRTNSGRRTAFARSALRA
jgi:hypothetical protein